MPGYGSDNFLARLAVKVYGSWFSAPGLVPPEPPRMLPLPADLVIGGMRERFDVMSRPLEKEGEDFCNIVYRPKLQISVLEEVDFICDKYLYYMGDYLRGKDENGNGPIDGYDEDGDGEPDFDGGDGGPGNVDYPENQKIHVVEVVNLNAYREDIPVCVPDLKYRDTQFLSIQEAITVAADFERQGTDNMIIGYHQ